MGAATDLWHERYPELGTQPIPVDAYVSEAAWQLEKQRIFRRVWLNVGRVEELPRPAVIDGYDSRRFVPRPGQ